MRVRECDGCGIRLREYELCSDAGRPWVELADFHGWRADACSAACALEVLREHLQEVTELAVVR